MNRVESRTCADRTVRKSAPIVLLALALSACACGPATGVREAAGAQDLLDQAIAAAGGEAALARSPVLTWTGEATVFAGERRIEIAVDTAVQPFTRARSQTWLRDQGRSTLRSLEIDGAQGWMTRDGTRAPMPENLREHERAQYAIYGLMRLLPLRDDGVVLRHLADDTEGLRGLHVEHPAAPASDLYFNAEGRLVYLTNNVPNPEGGTPLAQRFDFDGTISGSGIVWPRVLRIAQDGKPYFELRLQTFKPIAQWMEPL